MNSSTIETALERLGLLVDYPMDVELLLVGGAAAMVTGVLPASRTTTDCDVMDYAPPGSMSAVELAAERVAKELGLAPTWLNSDVQIRRDTLPDGWRQRRVHVGVYGRLHVWAASRLDLIAMKVIAGRAQDLEDLRDMRVRRDEAEFVRRHLASLPAKGTARSQIEDALVVLGSLGLDAR